MYAAHLSKDRKLKKLIQQHGEIRLTKRKNMALRLCRAIMSQQLSTKVADVIYNRFLALFDHEEPTFEQIATTPLQKLRGIGLSNAKAQYVLNVAAFATSHGLDDRRLSKMTDHALVEYLTQIKGVGKWTVEMQLMFTLARPDVFSIDDYGIQVAMAQLYGLNPANKKQFKEEMTRIASKWSPYRTFACMHLWRHKDTKKEPVAVKTKVEIK
ncbi:MAG TPA: DNA-3-methyladenine glycosylase 2 family protein [Chitinophagales bacterium]|nr:DNA-3-methyladenine glycosylase 2 family protein [Chitinophagales bacterium]